MAASDQTYRNQYRLDVVFAVSSVLMLISIIMMFAQDYFREFKTEQRAFADVEAAVAQRLAVAEIPNSAKFTELENAVKAAETERNKKEVVDKMAEIVKDLRKYQPKKEEAEAHFQDKKAVLDSKMSLYYILISQVGLAEANKQYNVLIEDLKKQVSDAKAVRDEYDEKIKDLQRQKIEIDSKLTDAESAWKKLNDIFEAQAKLAISKPWRFTDTVRDLPILDVMAPRIKIQQYTINDIPINFNFKYVKRYDRCTTCHLGIDRPAFTKDMLESLSKVTPEQEKELAAAHERLKQRRSTLSPDEAAKVPDPDRLKLSTLSASELTEARIKEFCAHPRMELFVGSNSKHPAEKFGCTSCHQGQGAATSFNGSFHTPNTSTVREEWTKKFDFGKDTHTFLWDFPMLPSRFIESSCLKCHHQVTDLYSQDNRNEAPKLLKGYNLLRENGCFGCHEIQGRKGGRPVGPDIRLEAVPPIESLSPKEREKIESDLDTKPGNMRKVGPSLYRLSEKTNRDWASRWLRGPRSFRPDTKMPHFYGLPNNDPSVLPDEQKKFPDAEMQAITHYLFSASDAYLKDLADAHMDGKDKADEDRLNELLAKPNLEPREKLEIPELRRRLLMRKSPLLKDLAPDYKGSAAQGRQLFSERGCLACHTHKGTEAGPLVKSTDASFAPSVASEAQFGPNLSQVVAKLGNPADKGAARKWLIQWVLDPHVHSPRSRMPVTHLTPHQAADIAEWLLSQSPLDLGDDWDSTTVKDLGAETETTLKNLARVYFVRLLPANLMDKLLKGEQLNKDVLRDLPDDEQNLAKSVTPDTLKYYLGKKAVGRLGCFACHDIPGFDATKPIGVGLLDWGKKDAERLAFEDIADYVTKKYHVVPSLRGKDGKPVGPVVEEGKKKDPYEAFFYDALMQQTREGFLHQKLLSPRSYDYNRMLAWDDRSRMPEFRFARARIKEGESKEAFEARKLLEEAEGREAVMTFVLGLVAEPVPLSSINEPKGDRLAEVKGRQVLDKYNCAGCHLIRPGVFDFKVDQAAAIMLDRSYALASRNKDHIFPNHYNWAGKNPATPNRLAALGVEPMLKIFNLKSLLKDKELEEVDADSDPNDPRIDGVSLRLGHALRFHDSEAKEALRDITAGNYMRIPVKDMIYPPPAVFKSKESMHARLGDLGQLGGAFSDLLLGYLVAKTNEKDKFYQFDPYGDSNYARAAGPPSLVGQGERTQSAWLYQFLLDPQQIRRMTILRMPRFNMSEDEARALVAYFAGVSRLGNTGTRLEFPNQVIPQEESFASPYWQAKNAAYIARLKATKGPDGNSLYEQRRAQLKPFWEGKLDQQLAASKERIVAAEKELEAAKKALEDAQNTKKDLTQFKNDVSAKEGRLAAARENERAWKQEIFSRQNQSKDLSAEDREKAWMESEAYLADSYKLVSKVCLVCHQVGNLQPENKLTTGPPLSEVFKRIRPDWAEHWIAAPQRMMPYSSVMPVNFSVDQKGQNQDYLAGSPFEQLIAARDLVMVLPRVEALPVSRYWALSLPGMTATDKK